MKKYIFLLLLAIPGFRLAAQTGLHVGVFAMPQNTWIFNQQEIDEDRSNFKYKPTWGYAGMFKLGFNFADPIGIHVGAIYSVQGQKNTSVDSLDNTIMTERSLTYLKIPILLHINSEPGPVMFNMEFGPQFGLLQSAQILDDDVPLNAALDAVQAFKANDISFTWAIGAEFMLTDWLSFVLVHRGDYGIFDMENKSFSFNGSNFYSTNRLKANNACFGIMGGFNFCINPQGGSKRTNLFWR